jgi:hypothetical protein
VSVLAWLFVGLIADVIVDVSGANAPSGISLSGVWVSVAGAAVVLLSYHAVVPRRVSQPRPNIPQPPQPRSLS